MANRITSTTVTFQRPFIMSGFDNVQAAGTYAVDTEEEQIEALSFPVWKRISTFMQLVRTGAIEHIEVDPDELHEALMRDGAQEHPAHPSSPSAAKTRRNTARAVRLITRKKV